MRIVDEFDLWLFIKYKSSVRNLKIEITKYYAMKLSEKSNYEFRLKFYQVILQLVCEIISFDKII